MTGKGIVLFSILVLVSDVVSVLINPLPQNKAVVNGATGVAFNCTSTPVGWAAIGWSFMRAGESGATGVANGNTVFPDYTDVYELTQVGKSTSTLTVKTVNESLAGTYICSETGGGSASAQLIVINSDLASTSNVSSGTDLTQGQTVQMSCSFSYAASSSNVGVNMTWSIINGSSSSSVQSPSPVITTTGIRSTAVSTITQTVGSSTPFPVYQCKTSFTVNGTTATNDPGYTNTTRPYNSPINVRFFNPNCSITGANSGDSVYSGTSITCIADGNPKPSYRWSNETNANFSADATIQITSGGQYTCTASNGVGSCTKSINLITYITTAPPSTSTVTTITSSTTTSNPGPTMSGQYQSSGGLSDTNKIIVGVVVGVGGFLLLVAIIAIICCCKKKNKSGAKYENGNAKPMTDYPPPYDGHVGPQRNSRPDSGDYASTDRQYPSQSSYVSGSPTHPQHVTDDGLNYAQIQLDNQPRSRQPLQVPQNNSNYVEIALA